MSFQGILMAYGKDGRTVGQNEKFRDDISMDNQVNNVPGVYIL